MPRTGGRRSRPSALAPLIGRNLGVKTVPIVYQNEGKKRSALASTSAIFGAVRTRRGSREIHSCSGRAGGALVLLVPHALPTIL